MQGLNWAAWGYGARLGGGFALGLRRASLRLTISLARLEILTVSTIFCVEAEANH
jgi:hypothetical protein